MLNKFLKHMQATMANAYIGEDVETETFYDFSGKIITAQTFAMTGDKREVYTTMTKTGEDEEYIYFDFTHFQNNFTNENTCQNKHQEGNNKILKKNGY